MEGGSITLSPSATNRSKPNNYLFYNRIPKCGSTTAIKYMRTLSYELNYHWIGEKLFISIPKFIFLDETLSNLLQIQKITIILEEVLKMKNRLPNIWQTSQINFGHMNSIYFSSISISIMSLWKISLMYNWKSLIQKEK